MRAFTQPLTIFLLGATGNLSRKKILRSIYYLHQHNLLAHPFTLIGVARKNFSREEFHNFAKEVIQPADQEMWEEFCKHLHYIVGDTSKQETFSRIREYHDSLDACGNHLWYLATLPKLYETIIDNLVAEDLHKPNCGWVKCMLEKPFGKDLSSARRLNLKLLNAFSEDQIFRVDHFLAKESVQNILAFRFANGIFENLWSHKHVDRIQILATESFGIDGRVSFYDKVSVVRDVVQNHVLQMLATTMMEEPTGLSAEEIREKRQQLLANLEPLTEESIKKQVAFGQYGSGEIGGKQVVAYQDEDDTLQGSKAQTALAMRTYVDNERWRGVPIYVLAGKRLKVTKTEIAIVFKDPPNQMFDTGTCKTKANVLIMRIQPNEGIELRMQAKKPGLNLELDDVPMQFDYSSEFDDPLIEAYTKLIHDVVQEDATLFARADGIEASWKFVQPLLDFTEAEGFIPDVYSAGSWGSEMFDKVFLNDCHEWVR